ncbi:N-acyl-D-amino-acid deacylase family protein [Cellulosilyticum sp. I15G10I2]|uniref:N-acyl-D-amino-acid deacylase family protein n=1 Tax=Cellulosilyticum sp. I15G10I2 TaxID=1892843 RepID=UPI00085C7289|nr:D-aminoacylase [Cellulosilyticum sp. I15G10I2]
MTLKIYNALIIDGTGKDRFYGELLIKDDRIVQIGAQVDAVYDRAIDAKGHVVAPGFIDTHSHSDLELLLADSFVKPKVMQGITTEILGQDGVAMAPLPEKYIEAWRKNLAGLDGDSDAINWHYENTKGYIEALQKAGMAVNAAYLVPHGNIRMEAMGLENREATDKEIEKMEELLERELNAGAIGLSTGLIYIPCAYSDQKELAALCKVVASKQGIFVTHQRSEANQIIASMQEILDVGRESGVKVHFSHFKICGKNNWDKIDEVFGLLDQAKKEGISVSLDQYPYTAGSTMLSVILPAWVHDGGTVRLLERLKENTIREKIKEDIFAATCEWDNFVQFAGLDGIYITSVKTAANQSIIGKNLVELGRIRGKEPLEAVFDLLIEEDNAVGMIDYYGKEEQIISIMKRPEQNVCTDGLLGGKPHPRVYGSFPRVLGKYVREEKVMTLEEAIYKMSGKPREVFSLKDRGLLKTGYFADIVIFNQDRIIDQGTYTDPMQFPQGIEYVLINGELVVEQGKHLSKKPGRFISN